MTVGRLHDELRRLYLPGATPTAPTPEDAALVDAAGQVRAMVMELAAPADWRMLSAAWVGAQADLGLPAAAIAVNGRDGLQLWWSLAQPLPASAAAAFLAALRQRYLADPDPRRVALWPEAAPPRHARLVPAALGEEGRWSAFVAPDLAAVMADEPWLDLPPNPDGQAALLAGLRSITPQDLQAALHTLQPQPPAGMATAVAVPAAAAPSPGHTDPLDDPRAFLLRVMNDAAVPLALRIEAAKALLPRA